jgi:hypothetical protein
VDKVALGLFLSEYFSAVGIATGYRLDDRRVGVRVPVWSRIFSSPRRPHRLCGPHSLLSNGYRGALSLGVKRQGREGYQLQLLPRSSKCGSIHPLPHTPWRQFDFTFTLLRFPLPIFIPTAPHSSLSSSTNRGWYNRPNCGRRTKWTRSHPTPRN